ncbi:Aliphatic (R)-hydroxynitrile lyase [Linum grandiflorum]
MVVDSNYAAKVINDATNLPPPHSSILSCAFATGYGSAWLEAQVKEGDSVAIFGVGSVGLSLLNIQAVIGAKDLKAKQIIVVDRNDTKLKMAMELGATYIINSQNVDAPVSEVVKQLTENRAGVDVSIEASGYDGFMNEAMKAAIKVRT